jgi:hypothetical protein
MSGTLGPFYLLPSCLRCRIAAFWQITLPWHRLLVEYKHEATVSRAGGRPRKYAAFSSAPLRARPRELPGSKRRQAPCAGFSTRRGHARVQPPMRRRRLRYAEPGARLPRLLRSERSGAEGGCDTTWQRSNPRRVAAGRTPPDPAFGRKANRRAENGCRGEAAGVDSTSQGVGWTIRGGEPLFFPKENRS